MPVGTPSALLVLAEEEMLRQNAMPQLKKPF